MPAPGNDNFASATVIAGASGTSGPVTIDSATTQGGEPSGSNWGDPVPHKTVWYQWTAPASQRMFFSTGASVAGNPGSGDDAGGLDTTLAVWTGATLGALVEVASNEDHLDFNYTSIAFFDAIASTTYRIQVGVFAAGYIGTVTLEWGAAPANDNLANATLLTGSTGSVAGSVIEATTDTPYDPMVDEAYGFLATVWYKLAVPDGWQPTGSALTLTFTDVSGDAPAVLLFGSNPYPPSSMADWAWLASDIHITGGTLSYSDAAPAGGFFYIGVAGHDDIVSFTMAWEFDLPPVGVSLALGDAPIFEVAPDWTRIDAPGSGARVQKISVKRGRPDEKEKTGIGTATISGIDLDGSLDPTNPGGTYTTGLNPRAQASVSLQNPLDSLTHSLFRGYVANLAYDIDVSGKFATFELELVDAFDILSDAEVIPDRAGVTVPEGSEGDVYYEGQQVDDRILAALADAAVSIGVTEWPPELMRIFSGNVAVQGTVYAPRSSILQVIQDAVDAELPGVANAYVDKDGVVTFHGRYARFHPDDVSYDIDRWKVGDGAAFDADPEVAVISGLKFTRGKANLINAALATPTGILDDDIAGQFVSDAASIAQFGAGSISFENLITGQGDEDVPLDALAETLEYAQYYVTNFAQPRNRVQQIVFRTPANAARAEAVWPLICGIEISDIVELKTTHPGGGGFDEDFYVEGITYDIVPGNADHPDVTLTLDVSPRAYYDTTTFSGDV